MTRDALTDRVGELADAVLADWRWVRDDLNVSVLGMLLYGFGLETGRAMGLAVADVDAAVDGIRKRWRRAEGRGSRI
jgi:hypothetical protein